MIKLNKKSQMIKLQKKQKLKKEFKKLKWPIKKLKGPVTTKLMHVGLRETHRTRLVLFFSFYKIK